MIPSSSSGGPVRESGQEARYSVSIPSPMRWPQRFRNANDS